MTTPRGSFPEPRDFQRAAHDALRAGFAAGHRRQMLCAATAAGKTYLAMRLINEALQKGRKAIFVADRITLIDQTSKVASGYGMPDHGVIQGQHWRTYPHRPFQIASVQTLARRNWPDSDVIVIDEAHSQYRSWTEHVMQTDAAVIGLSATPFSKGLGRIFSNLVNATTMAKLTEDGVLKRLRVITAHRPDMTGVEKRGGEWTDSGAAKAELTIAGDIVSEWLSRAADRKTIMFGPSIAFCEEMVAKFAAAGVMAATFTDRTTPDQRSKLLDEYRKPDSAVRILISVEALAKGFDVTDVSCVIDARPLRKSFSTWVQMIGRGLRQHPGLDDCLLLDHSGNAVRFAADFERLYFEGVQSLDEGEKLDAEARKEPADDREVACPSCGAVPFVRQCMSCGFVRPPKPTREIEKADMVELDLVTKGEDKRALYVEVASYVKAMRTALDEDAARRKASGIYKGLTGTWPDWQWHETLWPLVQPGACSAKTAARIRSRQIAYAKRTAA